MNIITKVWNYFNGNKTTIGAIIMVASLFMQEVTIDIWLYNPDWMPKLIQSLNWIGGITGAIGLTHKSVKQVTG